MTTALSLTSLASATVALSTVGDDIFNDMTKSNGFLGRVQLYSKGKAINHGLVMPGEYGIPEGDDKITRLGKSIDVLPLARRVKAIDMSDLENIVTSYDPTSEVFNKIKEKAGEKDSGCMYGISFLVFERKSGRFLEFFCGTVTSRKEASKIYDFLPAVINGENRSPRPLTLGSRVIDSGSYSWHGSTITECSTPITNLPEVEVVMKEIMAFLNPKAETVTKVDPATVANRRAR